MKVKFMLFVAIISLFLSGENKKLYRSTQCWFNKKHIFIIPIVEHHLFAHCIELLYRNHKVVEDQSLYQPPR